MHDLKTKLQGQQQQQQQGGYTPNGHNRWHERENRPIQTEASKKAIQEHSAKQDEAQSKKQAQKEQWEAELARELEYQRGLQQKQH